MKIEDLLERDKHGNLSWGICSVLPEVKDLPEEGFFGIAKKIISGDLNENSKEVSVPWATDFSYSSAIKDYIIDVETKRAAWVISHPSPKECTFIRPFAKKYNLRFIDEKGVPKTIYESDNSFRIIYLGLKEIPISEHLGGGDHYLFDVEI